MEFAPIAQLMRPLTETNGFASVDPLPLPDQTQSSIAPAEKREVFVAPTLAISKKALEIGDAVIPLIDLDAIANAQGNERKVLIEQFGNGLKDVGFIAVKADFLVDRISSVNSEIEKYFSQDVSEKMKDWRPSCQSGFSQQGRETAANAKKADIKETYFIPPGFTEWPSYRQEFKETMRAYHAELTIIATQVMAYIAEYLNEPTEDVAKSVSSACNLLRLAYYPAPKPTDDLEAVWAAAHEDLNALTLLPPSTVPGLQLLTKDGEWKSVNVPQGYLIINTGEQLQNKTAGMIQATRHRVVNPGGEHARQCRYASIFFASWSPEFSLAPFTSCVDKMTENMTEDQRREYLKQFPDVNVQENLLSRLIEMRSISDPSEELVSGLRKKGLLQQPPEELVKRFPALFDAPGIVQP